jgi:hypothetical protein
MLDELNFIEYKERWGYKFRFGEGSTTTTAS